MEVLVTLFLIVTAVVYFHKWNESKTRKAQRIPPKTGAKPKPCERQTSAHRHNPGSRSRQSAPTASSFNSDTSTKVAGGQVVEGPAYVIDGDSLVIRKTQIRLFGIDAPELNHPFGQKAKWAMVALCKGQKIRAEIIATDDHRRSVAKCYLPDGKDLSAEMVAQNLAIDWPKFSGGAYRHLEPEDARRRMWLADARQKGNMKAWERFEATQKAR